MGSNLNIDIFIRISLRLSCLTALLTLLLTVSLKAQAPVDGWPSFFDDWSQPFSVKFVSPDKKYVFVMLGPSKKDEESSRDWIRELGKELRSKYTKSGMYRNDGSNEPLWTVDWYSKEIYLFDDPRFVAAVFDPPPPKYEGEAISFYDGGRLMRSYSTKDLISDFSVAAIVAPRFEFRWYCGAQVKPADLFLAIFTDDSWVVDFDASTGNMVNIVRGSGCLDS
jgi:hypothetical protein